MRIQVFPLAIILLSSLGSLLLGIVRCAEGSGSPAGPNSPGSPNSFAPSSPPGSRPSKPNGEDRFAPLRQRMVEYQIRGRGIANQAVLAAMLEVPRHLFVPSSLVSQAYEDGPLSIGYGQTISQPYIVALMTDLIRPAGGQKVLDIGTGSGYQAAVVSEIVGEVYSIEILEPLAREAERRLATLGYKNVKVRAGDGYRGWPEVAPFDGIIVAAAPDHVPQPLVDQLKVGGRLVLPVGEGEQDLLVITRTASGVQQETIAGVRFVPMTGEAETRHR